MSCNTSVWAAHGRSICQYADFGFLLLQLLVNARSESDCYKSERDELAEVVLEMQEEIEQLRAATAAAQT